MKKMNIMTTGKKIFHLFWFSILVLNFCLHYWHPLYAQYSIGEDQPWLNIELKNLDSGDGVLIIEVDSSSSAYQADLRVGDVIRKFEERQITNKDDYLSTLWSLKIGDKVTLVVEKQGRAKKIKQSTCL